MAAAEGLLVATFDLTGRSVRTPPTAIQTIPYYLTTDRPPRSEPKARAAERRLSRKHKTGASSPARPVPAAPPSVAAAPPTPDYGRWTVAPGAWPQAGQGGISMSVCDPARLASLPADARKACAERLQSASAAGPPARRGPAPDWNADHDGFSCSPKNEPAHKWLIDHCRGLGIGLKYKF